MVAPNMADNVFVGLQVVVKQAVLVFGRVGNVEWAGQVKVPSRGVDNYEPVVAVFTLLPV